MAMGAAPPGGAAGEEASVRSGTQVQGRQRGMIHLTLVCRDAEGNITGTLEDDFDPCTLQTTQFYIASQLGVASGFSFLDTSNSSHAQTAQTLSGTPQIAFGTGTIGVNPYSAHAINTLAGGVNPVTATASAITAGSASGTFTVTATWSNTTGLTVTISELGLYVTTTAGMASNSTFMLTYDTFAGQAVSAGGTAAATLTFTFG
jgi:hypothetical protein